MKAIQFFSASLLVLLCLNIKFAAADGDDEEVHEHPFEYAAAIDIAEPGVYTIMLQKTAHEEGEDHDHEGDDHDHDHELRMLDEGEGEEEEYEYENDHVKAVMVMATGSCEESAIETSEEEAEELFENNETDFVEIEAGQEPINVSVSVGTLTRELHTVEYSYISLFYFNILESGCLVIYSEHELEDGFFRDSAGEEIEPSFTEPEEEALGNYSAEIWLVTMAATLIACLLSLIGAFFLLCGLTKEASLIAEYSEEIMAFALGVLLAVVFIHLLPEANDYYGSFDWTFGVVVLASIMVAFLIKLLVGHQHGKPDPEKVKLDGKVDSEDIVMDASLVRGSASLNILWGDAFHNFMDGILIATAFGACASDNTLGWTVTVSVILHEIPQELADFVVIYNDYKSVGLALCFNLLSSLSAFLGAILVLSIGSINSDAQGIFFGINIGALLFICLAEIAPRLVEAENSMRLVIRVGCIILGMIVIGMLQLAPHEHCEVGGHGHGHDEGHDHGHGR